MEAAEGGRGGGPARCRQSASDPRAAHRGDVHRLAWRGRHLRVFFACMYFAALRPGEVKALRKDGCFLPASGWGRLTLSRSRPQSNRRWTDSGEAFDDRGLQHRAEEDTRPVPIPPELVMILREQHRGVRDRCGWAAIQDGNRRDDL